MACSTNGILCLGIDMGRPGDGDWPEEFREWFERTDDIDCYHWWRDELDGKFPVNFIPHCSDGDRMWIFAVRGMVHQATRGYPRLLDLPTLMEEATDEKIDAFRKWLNDRGFGDIEPPTWLLASFWSD